MTKRVIALGFFDGVHLGHGALLRAVKAAADRLEAVPCAFTFDRSPTAALTGQAVPLLTGVYDRTMLMHELYGIGQFIVAPFQKLRQMDWRDFVAGYLREEHHAVHVVAGHDFHFGYRGEGDPDRLRAECARLGMGCDIIPKVELEGVTVSSTYIRTLIAQGELERAMRFLGHPHVITGQVSRGRGIGHSVLGFPTVNLYLPEGIIVPAHGVYTARLWVLPEPLDHGECLSEEGPYMAVTNVGVRPTVEEGGAVSVESFLPDRDLDLYGRTVRVELYRFLRPEQRFPSPGALREQIGEDIRQTRAYFDTI